MVAVAVDVPVAIDQVVVSIADRTAAEEDAEQQRRAAVAKFLRRARTAFQTSSAATTALRVEMAEDLEFVASKQWDDEALQERNQDNRPALTINRLPQFIRQVTNAQRSAHLAIKVVPIDSGADIKTAEIFQSLVRHIEDQSDASVAYSTAGDAQVRMGLGYWRIVAEYSDDETWVQDLRIKRIRNPFMVYFDPAAQEVDGSDARFCLLVQDIPKDEYIDRFGDASFASLTSFMSVGDTGTADWMPEGRVRVAEYWFVDETPSTKLLLSMPDPETGAPVEHSVDQAEYDAFPNVLKAMAKIVARRPVRKRVVKHALINAAEILEGNDDKTDGAVWPGKWIPIIPVIGEEIDLNGRVDLRGMVRDAKDPQREYNYQKNALVEMLASNTLSQWVGYFGQFEGHQQKWNQANRRRFPYLEVNGVSADGKPLPLPQRITSGPDISPVVAAIAQADNDMKATMGLWDPSLGQRGPQQSGKAIERLQQQGEQANSNFLDNLSRSIRFTGRQLVDLIPHFYDVPRIVRVVGSDEQERTVMVHAGADASALPPPNQLPDGIEGVYDLSAGRYDVSVTVGPSEPNKRREAAAALTDLIQAFPGFAPIIGDLLVKNMDWPGAQAAAQRLKKAVPPQFQDEQPGGAPDVNQVQQENAQLKQAMQMLQQALQEAQDAIKSKQVESASKERIEAMRVQAQRDLAEKKMRFELLQGHQDHVNERELLQLDADIKLLEQMLGHGHDAAQLARTHAASHATEHHRLSMPPPAKPTPGPAQRSV